MFFRLPKDTTAALIESTALVAKLQDKLAAEQERVKELEGKLRMEEELHRVTESGLMQSAEELAAAQATIAEMREYFDLIKNRFCGWNTVAEKALALPANLDALHEALAKECERLATERDAISKGLLPGITRWFLEQAAAHRARKEAK